MKLLGFKLFSLSNFSLLVFFFLSGNLRLLFFLLGKVLGVFLLLFLFNKLLFDNFRFFLRFLLGIGLRLLLVLLLGGG